MESEDSGRERTRRGLLAEAVAAGIGMPASVVLGLLVGSAADGRFGTSPVGLAIGVLLGFAGALVSLFRLGAAWDRVSRGGKSEKTRAEHD